MKAPAPRERQPGQKAPKGKFSSSNLIPHSSLRKQTIQNAKIVESLSRAGGQAASHSRAAFQKNKQRFAL
jgi:hypothetical protein